MSNRKCLILQQIVLLLILMVKIVYTQNQQFCSKDSNKIIRSSNSILINIIIDDWITISSNTSNQLILTSDLFDGMGINANTAIIKSCQTIDETKCPIENETVNCSISGKVITCLPWVQFNKAAQRFSKANLQITFTKDFSDVIPKQYDNKLEIVLLPSGTRFQCDNKIDFVAYQQSSTIKMELATSPVEVGSTNPIIIRYKPQFKTLVDEIQIFIGLAQYYRDFTDLYTNTVWIVTGLKIDNGANIYLSQYNCSTTVGAISQCIAIRFSAYQTLQAGTEYQIKIENFIFPFHPLSFNQVNFKMRYNQYECEQQTIQENDLLKSSQFSPKTISNENVKIINFVSQDGSSTGTGNAGKKYSKVQLSIANPLLILANTILDLIFPMEYFTYSSSDAKDVKIIFQGTKETFISTFIINQPSNNFMKASFTISTKQQVSSNDIMIELSNPIMGLDAKTTYYFKLNSYSTDLSGSNQLIAQQFGLTSANLGLNPSVMNNLVLDTNMIFQIGTSSKYTFKITPVNQFTSSQIWITITFPTPSYSFDTPTQSCYEVNLNGSTLITNQIIEIARSSASGEIQLQVPFPSSIQVNSYTVSTCNIKNPSVTGQTGTITVEANYASKSFQTEYGKTTANIQPAQLLDGTKIEPLNLANLTTMENNGYKFTLILPVKQVVGNKLKIYFPDYLNNLAYDTSSSSIRYNNIKLNNQAPNIAWEGILQDEASNQITISFKGYNPPVTKSSYSFKVEFYDTINNIQLSKDISYSTDLYTPRQVKDFTVTRLSQNNAEQTTYTYSINLDYFIENIFFLRIELHNSQNIIDLKVKEISSPLKLNTLTSRQTIDGIRKYIDISSTLVSGFTNKIPFLTQFVFEVQTIQNYRSVQPLNLLLMTGQSQTMIGINNYIPLSESSVSLKSIQNQYFGEQSLYEFDMKFDIGIPINGKFDIITTNNFPNSVSIISIPSNIFLIEAIAGNKMTIKCTAFECKSFNLKISSIINPIYDQFNNSPYPTIKQINTYDNDVTKDYLMQKVDFSQSSLNYSNKCYPSKPYTKFCKDCNNQDCTSCYTSAIFGGLTYDKLNTLNNSCVQTCPIGTYQSALNCISCTNNCLTCLGENQCLSCQQSYVLQGDKCQKTCDSTFYADDQNICQKCDKNNCSTCKSHDNCLTCQNGFGLIIQQDKGVCVDCSKKDGYYDKQDGSQVCGICNSACRKCSLSSTQCSLCVDVLNGKSVYFNPTLNKCTTDCYADGYSLLLDNSGNYICGKCTQGQKQCNTCQNLPDFCISCASPYYLQSNKCVLKEEITPGFFGNDITRIAEPCLQVCTECVSKTICTKCISNFFLSKGNCSSSCPEDLPISDGQGGCKEDISTKVGNISDDNRVVPFPMLLASIAFCISIYFSKYEYTSTFVPGCVVGFCSLFEWISWITLIATAASNSGMNSTSAILALLGFLFLYVINITQFILSKKYIENDPPFMEWIIASDKNRLCYTIIKYASLIISFKAHRVVFSKYFNQSFFKAKLNSIDTFSSFNKLALVSVFLNSSLIIISSAIVTYTYAKQSQGFFLGLDSLIVTIMMIMFMIWDSLKKKDFFEEPLSIDQTFSYRFPFDQSYMEKLEKRANNSRMSRGESNSSLADFRENKKVTIHENMQKPLSQVLDPNEISPNASIDPNVIKNSEYGAPYLIQDHIYENYKPGSNGGKRNFEKKHIAPQFDYSKYNPIQENSNEDEDFDDEEHMDLKSRQNQSLNQSQILKQNNKMENARGFKGGNGQGRSFYGENGEYQEEEPVPQKPNTRHTVYYNDNVQEMLNSQSTRGGVNNAGNSGIGSSLQQQQQAGVSIGVNMNDEEDEENKELRSRIYSKPSMNPDDVMMRQSYSPKNMYGGDNSQGNDSKQAKTEGNARSGKKSSIHSPANKNKKGSQSPSRSRSISPSLAKIEDQKAKKKSQSPKRQKSTPSDPDNPNMRNSYTSNKSNKSNKSKKNSPKKSGSKVMDDDNMLFYFAHPVDGDQALPPNQQQNGFNQQKPKQGKEEIQNANINDENRVERIMPIEEDLDQPNQKQIQPKYDMANQMKMKGPYNNDKNRARGLLGLEDEEDNSQNNQIQNNGRGNDNNYQGSQEFDRNIYDSSESVRTAEEAEVNYNEVSPSDFNVLNQRYEEDFFSIQMQQQIQKQQLKQNGQNLLLHPDSSLQSHSVQMGSVIQSPHNQMLGSQQNQFRDTSNQFNQRPPLLLGNSNSNISVGIPKTTQSAGGKKKSKSKPRSTSKNRTNISTQGHPIKHQGLMTPTSGSTQVMRRNLNSQMNNQEYNNQANDPYSRGNNSPMGSYRNEGGIDNYMKNNMRPNSQEQSDGFVKSSNQNMYATQNSKSGNPRESRVSQGSRMGNISPTNSSKMITYKVPQSDLNKLKSLEKIYLQRLEISTGNNPQSASKKQKKNKQHTQNMTDNVNDFDSQSAHSQNMNNFNGYYGSLGAGDNRQPRDTSDIHAPSDLLMDNPNSLVIADFGDDGSYKE